MIHELLIIKNQNQEKDSLKMIKSSKLVMDTPTVTPMKFQVLNLLPMLHPVLIPNFPTTITRGCNTSVTGKSEAKIDKFFEGLMQFLEVRYNLKTFYF